LVLTTGFLCALLWSSGRALSASSLKVGRRGGSAWGRHQKEFRRPLSVGRVRQCWC